jgi:hypothetical protein
MLTLTNDRRGKNKEQQKHLTNKPTNGQCKRKVSPLKKREGNKKYIKLMYIVRASKWT